MTSNDLIEVHFGKSVISGNSFLCEETDRKAELRKVTVMNIPANTIVLKLENISLEGLIDKSRIKRWGYNQHSDFVIVSPHKCIFIEMKSTLNLGNVKEEVRRKFISDQCLVEYADSIFKHMLNKQPFFELRSFHYVLFYRSLPLAKPQISMASTPKLPNNTPDTFRPLSMINDSQVDFKDLY